MGCAMCEFVDEKSQSLLSGFEIEDTVQNCAASDLNFISLGNKAEWLQLKKEDPAINQAVLYKKSGHP